MDKQKVLEELDKTGKQFFQAASNVEIESNSRSVATGVVSGLGIAKSVVAQMDEPQRVKVPAYVAEWIEWSQNHKWALSNVVDASNIKYFEDHNEPTGLTSWFVKKGHDEILARAWLDGYEVEEADKWMVKSNQLYFTGITQLIAHDPLTYNFVKDQKHAHIFDDKNSAEKEASYFNGTVEKAESE